MRQGYIFDHWKCQQTRNVWLLILFSSHIRFLYTTGWSHADFLGNWQKTRGGKLMFWSNSTSSFMLRVTFTTLAVISQFCVEKCECFYCQDFFPILHWREIRSISYSKEPNPQTVGWAAGAMEVDKSKQWIEILNTVFLNSDCLRPAQSSVRISSCWTYMRFNMVDLEICI